MRPYYSSSIRQVVPPKERLKGERVLQCSGGRCHSVFVTSGGRCFAAGRLPIAEPGSVGDRRSGVRPEPPQGASPTHTDTNIHRNR